MIPPTSIDGTDITGATIDGTDVTEITVDGNTVFTSAPDIPDSAVYYSRFYEGSGSTVEDEVSGTLGDINGASWVTGTNQGTGDAHLDFDGSNDDVDTNVVPVTGSQNRTFAAWINPDSFTSPSDLSVIFGYGSLSTGRKWVVEVLRGQLRIATRVGSYDSTLTPSIGTWQFVACVLDGNTVGDHTLYLDGTTDTASGNTSVNTGSTTDAHVGVDPVRSRGNFDGGIDGVWVANKAFTTSELDDWRDLTKADYGL